MTLRIATWNVNSIRQRLDHLDRFIAEEGPDVICLQEIKVHEELFPRERFAAQGYRHMVVSGQKAYNGVAILSRLPFEAEGCSLWCEKDDKRHAYVRLAEGIEIHNFYVPSGGPEPDPESNPRFAHKLRFLGEMAAWAAREGVSQRKALLVGDLNVAPLEHDVWNHKRLLRSVGHTPGESERMLRIHEAGRLMDIPRHFTPSPEPLYSWWGYRYPGAVEKDYGWRLDHALATPGLAPAVTRCRTVKGTRLWERPSDHVPILVELG